MADVFYRISTKVSESEALQYFEQILSGYKEMVKNGVIHRDIKLENILIHNEQLKIVDFGFCSIHDPNQLFKKLDQTVLGSPIYMGKLHYYLKLPKF